VVVTYLARQFWSRRLSGRHVATDHHAATPPEVEFRDGVHGLLVWEAQILIGAALTFAMRERSRRDLMEHGAQCLQCRILTDYPSDRTPGATIVKDSELRVKLHGSFFPASVALASTPDDRDYLVRAVMMQTGLAQPEAEARLTRHSRIPRRLFREPVEVWSS